LLFKTLDNAANSQKYAENQQRELMLLREQMENQHRNTLWSIYIGAIIISVAILLQ